VVDIDDVDRLDSRISVGVGSQQRPARPWEQIHRLFQELDAVEMRHPVVGQDRRDRLAPALDLLQRVQGV
jgi:hypothetical protein